MRYHLLALCLLLAGCTPAPTRARHNVEEYIKRAYLECPKPVVKQIDHKSSIFLFRVGCPQYTYLIRCHDHGDDSVDCRTLMQFTPKLEECKP